MTDKELEIKAKEYANEQLKECNTNLGEKK